MCNNIIKSHGKIIRGQPPEWKILHRVADNMSRSIRVSFTKGFGVFRNEANTSDIIDAWNSGHVPTVEAVIPWDKLEDSIPNVRPTFESGFIAAANKSVKALPVIRQPVNPITADNPLVDQVLNTQIGNLITGISEKTRTGVRFVIRDSFKEGLPPRTAAKLIKDSIGLTEPQAKSLVNFRNNQIAQGIKGKRLDERVERFRKKKLKERSLNIARTETIRAVNLGQLQTWKQGAEENLFDTATVKKAWIVTPDDVLCPICIGIDELDQRILVDDEFQVPANAELGTPAKTVLTPPAHPQCRCAMKLVF